mmetsp:Transcript_11222/g.16379  ORF Transcript_11222/g.16379 Transcript_11222/m.16379 type:complete len:234 (-) Transcript_11222:97-798(-)
MILHTAVLFALMLLCYSMNISINLLPQLKQKSLVALNLLLKLKQSKQKSFSGGRTPRYIDVHWNNPITSPDDRVRIVIISTTIRTGSHGNNPPRLGHLIINLPQSRRHLIRQGSGDDHDIGLTGGGTEYHTETLHIVSGGGGVHHFYSAASKSEGHGPERTLARPIDEVVYFRHGIFYFVGSGDCAARDELVYAFKSGNSRSIRRDRSSHITPSQCNSLKPTCGHCRFSEGRR